jgi:rhodanese-related sulfurtransferase
MSAFGRAGLPVTPSFLEFVRNNLLLFGVAVASGAMLLWPLVRRSAGGPSVDASGATRLINGEGAVVVDVRDESEYQGGHILGARHLPISRLESPDLKRKDKTLILYCDSGARASKAAAALRKQGFEKVLLLNGGIGAWKQAGLPIEK